MTKVSILIPVFNTEEYIEKTIQTVLNQTYQEFELIIVDDCSTDSTFSICEKLSKQDSRIKLFKNQKNLGMMPNWNHGLTLCKGEYFGKLDADDYWHPNFIQECISVLDKHSDVGFICSGYEEIDESDNFLEGTRFFLPDFAKDKSFSFLDLLMKGPKKMYSTQVARQGIGLMRKDIFDQTGPFTLLPAGDTEMWFRTGLMYKAYGINKIYHQHRIWSSSFTRTQVLSDNKGEKNLFDATQEILKRYLEKGIISKAIFNKYYKEGWFHWAKSEAYILRESKGKLRSLLFMIKMCFKQPITFLKFYLSRISNKVSG